MGCPEMMTNVYGSIRIIESYDLLQDGESYEVVRSWRIRLFSLPWRPWVRSYTVVPRIPHTGAIQLNANTLVMHPETVRKLKRIL